MDALGTETDGEGGAVAEEEVDGAGAGFGWGEDKDDIALGAVHLVDDVALDGIFIDDGVDDHKWCGVFGVGEDSGERGGESEQTADGAHGFGHAAMFVDEGSGVLDRGVGTRFRVTGLTSPETKRGARHEVGEIELAAGGDDLAKLALEGVAVDGFIEVLTKDRSAEWAVVDNDGGLVWADGFELAHDGEHIALAGPAIDLALDTLPEIVGIDLGNGETCLAEIAGEFAEVLGCGELVVAVPLRFVLDHDERAASGDGGLHGFDLLGQGVEVFTDRFEEGLVRGAELDIGDVEEPCGEPAEVPARTDERAWADDGVHVVLCEQGHEVLDVVVVFKVVCPGAGLDEVPEDGGFDGVDTRGLGGADAVFPEVAGDALEVHGT